MQNMFAMSYVLFLVVATLLIKCKKNSGNTVVVSADKHALDVSELLQIQLIDSFKWKPEFTHSLYTYI